VTNHEWSRTQYNKGAALIEDERRDKAGSMAIPFMISLGVIIFLVILDVIHYCQPLPFGRFFCF